ncbi:MAG: hypothetical protein IAE86_03040 [Burkholderiaceae bacterium]|nr:hypothetical protein [Burkholderiaceae bacterium]
MPPPAPTPADTVGRMPVQRTAQLAALATTGLALVLAAAGLFALSAPEPVSALPWLLAVGLACAAAAVGWVLWRQRALEAALHDARVDAAGLGRLVEGWIWRSDAAHRLTHLHAVGESADAAPRDAIGRPPWEVFGADGDAAAALRSRLEAGLPLEGLIVSHEPAPGERRRVALHGHAVLDSMGRRTGYLGRARPGGGADIPAPVTLAQATAAEPEPNEHESFTYTVSHDLRAPIRVVEGFTKILKEDYGHQLDRIGNDHLDRVLGAAARMNSMIDALLTLSQLSSRPLARQPVNLSQLAGFVADDLRRQTPQRQVGVHIEDGLQAQGDPTLLRVVLENLLGNAWKYTAKRPDAQIWFERGEHDGRPAFCVRDNGAGFDMRFADRLFGVFQRLHSANDFQGTGVGLASVQRIVRRHGGEIWAESEVQRGSRFHFTLPPANPAA